MTADNVSAGEREPVQVPLAEWERRLLEQCTACGQISDHMWQCPTCGRQACSASHALIHLAGHPRVEPDPPHALDDCRAAVGADWADRFVGQRPQLLDNQQPSAAQEIRLRLAEALLSGGGEVDDGALPVLEAFAAWVEHGWVRR